MVFILNFYLIHNVLLRKQHTIIKGEVFRMARNDELSYNTYCEF